MKNQLLKQVPNNKLLVQEPSQEEFTEIHTIVEGLLAAIDQKKKQKSPKTPSLKKWKKKPKKSNTIEDLGIRELPFTF